MRRPVSIMFALASAGVHSLPAQHAGHDMAAMRDSSRSLHVMAQAIPLFTRAMPGAGGVDHSQFVVAQGFVMLRGATAKGRFTLDATLNGEGVTMPNGELNTGASGEGFVDKRHPHTYVHELMGSWVGGMERARFSLSAGRGFAAFGTDDPMMRPLEKYPLDHHLSQILERAVVTGALRSGLVILEGSTFGGDEPTSPGSVPSRDRFGDSWSLRGTLLPSSRLELQGSYARVASPEERGGFGLDQRKLSGSIRGVSADRRLYGLASWARTRERDHSRNVDVFAYDGAVLEGSMRIGEGVAALRFEVTDRPEHEREADPFRTPQPGSDLSIGGITRWRAATLHLGAPHITHGFLTGTPFVEVARLDATARDALALLGPQRLYGTSNFWMFTAGIRVRAGGGHDRMGRYGVALP